MAYEQVFDAYPQIFKGYRKAGKLQDAFQVMFNAGIRAGRAELENWYQREKVIFEKSSKEREAQVVAGLRSQDDLREKLKQATAREQRQAEEIKRLTDTLTKSHAKTKLLSEDGETAFGAVIFERISKNCVLLSIAGEEYSLSSKKRIRCDKVNL